MPGEGGEAGSVNNLYWVKITGVIFYFQGLVDV